MAGGRLLNGMPDASSLPNDLEACRTLIAELSAQLSEKDTLLDEKDALLSEQTTALVSLQSTRETLSQKNEELTLTIEKLLARFSARRSERHEDPNQQKLNFGDDPAQPFDPDLEEGLADAVAEAKRTLEETTARRRRPPRRPRHERLPAHLERYEVTAPMPDADRLCPTHGPREIIGYDVTETLEFLRPVLRVRVTKYPKFVCASRPQCGVAQPPRPNSLVEGDRYDTSVAAEIITNKHAYHIPIYRGQDRFAGSGWMPQRSTLLNIMSSAAYVLEPLYLFYAGLVRSAPVVPTDDTPVMLLLPRDIPAAREGDVRSQRIHDVLSAARTEDRSHVLARMWVYRSLGADGANVFDFTVSRHRDGPQEFLKDFEGTLLGDCYAGFESLALASDSRIVRAGCHAHARRYVYEARDYHPLEASRVLAWYRQLYDIEDQARCRSADEVLALRQKLSAPLMGKLRQWLDGDAARNVLPKSRLGEAVRYLDNQWDALTVFLSDGRVPFDNNETEQLMKQVATGRKNWLFIGSVEAGYRASILMTIVSTAHRHHLDVWQYVKDVLDRLLQGDRDLVALRADRWAAAHPDALRPYRIEEARYRADAKADRRAHRREVEQQRSTDK
jgi:transposase